jgi:site-specific DNA-methyltransferase (adenine-specific)
MSATVSSSSSASLSSSPSEDTLLLHGDCIEQMSLLPDSSIDMVCVDPPYGTTQNSWDNVIDPVKMWNQLKRVVKKDGAVLIFSSQPFTSQLIASNFPDFKQELIWSKNHAGGFLNANRMHLKAHENICLFSRGTVKYNPQKKQGEPYKRSGSNTVEKTSYGQFTRPENGIVNDGTRHPTSILNFDIVPNPQRRHPTEKPLAILKYLILTYSDSGDTILDFTMGSGSTGVAALSLGRRFVGIEVDDAHFKTASTRISMPDEQWRALVSTENTAKRLDKKRKQTDSTSNTTQQSSNREASTLIDDTE